MAFISLCLALVQYMVYNQLVYGNHPVMQIKVKFATWSITFDCQKKVFRFFVTTIFLIFKTPRLCPLSASLPRGVQKEGRGSRDIRPAGRIQILHNLMLGRVQILHRRPLRQKIYGTVGRGNIANVERTHSVLHIICKQNGNDNLEQSSQYTHVSEVKNDLHICHCDSWITTQQKMFNVNVSFKG